MIERYLALLSLRLVVAPEWPILLVSEDEMVGRRKHHQGDDYSYPRHMMHSLRECPIVHAQANRHECEESP